MLLYYKQYYGFRETEGTAVRTGLQFLFYAEGVLLLSVKTQMSQTRKYGSYIRGNSQVVPEACGGCMFIFPKLNFRIKLSHKDNQPIHCRIKRIIQIFLNKSNKLKSRSG
jgi:hypothetical protein